MNIVFEHLYCNIDAETSRRKKSGVAPATKRKFAGQAPPTTLRLRADSDDNDKGRGFLTLIWCADPDSPSDDFRTALNQANSYIKSLASVPRQVQLPSSPSSTSSSSVQTSSEQDRTRVDIMNKLVTLLQRNMRVRYEIAVEELAQA